MRFWRDVTRIRHLIEVNINFWALCWCNFLSQSDGISHLACRCKHGLHGWWMKEATTPEGTVRCEWLWSLLHPHACPCACAHSPASFFPPLWVELHAPQRRTAGSYLRHVWTSLYILGGLYSEIPLLQTGSNIRVWLVNQIYSLSLSHRHWLTSQAGKLGSDFGVTVSMTGCR